MQEEEHGSNKKKGKRKAKYSHVMKIPANHIGQKEERLERERFITLWFYCYIGRYGDGFFRPCVSGYLDNCVLRCLFCNLFRTTLLVLLVALIGLRVLGFGNEILCIRRIFAWVERFLFFRFVRVVIGVVIGIIF